MASIPPSKRCAKSTANIKKKAIKKKAMKRKASKTSALFVESLS